MPLGKPWLYKPDTKIKTLSLCPHCNCMTHTIEGLCGKCMNTKIKPDWEEKELKLLKDKKILMPQLYSFEEVRKLVLYQEEQHKKKMQEHSECVSKIELVHQIAYMTRTVANELEKKLKQQHREQLEGLKMKRWEYIPETAASPVPNLPGHAGNSQFFDNKDGYNAAVDEINTAITNLLEQKGK